MLKPHLIFLGFVLASSWHPVQGREAREGGGERERAELATGERRDDTYLPFDLVA